MTNKQLSAGVKGEAMSLHAEPPRIVLPPIQRCEPAYILGPTGAPEVAHPDEGWRCIHCGLPPYNAAGPFDPLPPCDVLNGVKP